MIIFNLLLAAVALWNFQRVMPVIGQIYEQNIKSLSACEDMLSAMSSKNIDIKLFADALHRAAGNITEASEQQIINELQQLLPQLDSDAPALRSKATKLIIELTNCNKQAIFNAARRTQKLNQSGAWGTVFMTLIFFLSAIYFEQYLRRKLLMPLQEIAQVLEDNARGNTFRRCNTLYAANTTRKLFDYINTLLDRNSQL